MKVIRSSKRSDFGSAIREEGVLRRALRGPMTVALASVLAGVAQAQTAPTGNVSDANIPVVAAATSSATTTYVLNRDESVSYLQQGNIVVAGCAALDATAFRSGTGLQQNLIYDSTANHLYIMSPLSDNDPGIVAETPNASGGCNPSPAVDLIGGQNYLLTMASDAAESNLYVVDEHEGVNIDTLYVLNTGSFASYPPNGATTVPSYDLDYSGTYGKVMVDPTSHLVYIPELAAGAVGTTGPGFWVFDPTQNKIVRVLGYVDPVSSSEVNINSVQILIAGNGKIVVVNANPTAGTTQETTPLYEFDTTKFSFFSGTQAGTGFPSGVYIKPPSNGLKVFTATATYSSISAADIDLTDGLVYVSAYDENSSAKIAATGLLISYSLATGAETDVDNSVAQPLTNFAATYTTWGQVTFDTFANEVLLYNGYFGTGTLAISTLLSSGNPQMSAVTTTSFNPLGVAYNATTGYIYIPSVLTPSGTPSGPAVYYLQPAASGTPPAADSLSLSGVPSTALPGTGFSFDAVFTSAGTGTPTGNITISATPTSGAPVVVTVPAGTAFAAGPSGTSVALSLPDPGTYMLSATYGGDSHFASASTSATYSVKVGPFSDSLPLTAPATATVGTKFTATVQLTSPGTLAPTGNVTITATPSGGSATTVAAVPASSALNINATVSITLPSAGTYTLSAAYAGDSNFAAATSQPQTVTVSAATAPPPQGTPELIPGVVSIFATTSGTAGSAPASVAVDASSDLFVLDHGLNTVVEYPAGGGGPQTVLPASGGPVALSQPSAIVYESSTQTLLVSDTKNNRLVRITPGTSVTATALALAGIPAATSICSNVIAGTALCVPTGLAEDSAGNIYVSDTGYDRVIKLSSTGAYQSTVISSSNTELTSPLGLAVDPSGNVYIANGASSGGAILEVSFSGGVSDLDIPGLINPQGLAVDAAGNLYFSDLGAHTLGLVQNGGTVLAFAGSGAASDSADSGPAALAGIASPLGVAYDGAGNVYVADSSETAANGGLILKINGTQADMVFGSVPSGQTSSPTRVILLNTGAGTVEITSDVLGGVNMADFTLGEECELQLPPAGSCDLSATFKPSLLGAENATLTLTAKTPGGSSSTLTVQLSGTGGAQQQAAAPTFNPPAGTYNGGQTVAMSSITPNAVIYYTTDGSTPTTSSTQYSTPIGVTASETLNALATAPGYINSTVATAAYTITYTTTGTFTFTGQPAGGGNTYTPVSSGWTTTIGSSSSSPLDTTSNPSTVALLIQSAGGYNAPVTISSDFTSSDGGTWYCSNATGKATASCTVTPTTAGTIAYITFIETRTSGAVPARINAGPRRLAKVKGASLGFIGSAIALLFFGLVWRKRGIFQAGTVLCLLAIVVSASILLAGCNPSIESFTITAAPAVNGGGGSQHITAYINCDTSN